MTLVHLEPIPLQFRKADLLNLLSRQGGMDRNRVGNIQLRGKHAAFEVPDRWVGRLIEAFQDAKLDQKRLRIWAEKEGYDLPPPKDEDHFDRLLRLLTLESHAEAVRAVERSRRRSSAEAEKSDNTLLDLEITDEGPGLGGRYIVRLARRKSAVLPWTRLDVGTPVVLSPDAADATGGHRGIVSERATAFICVALPGLPDDLGETSAWRLDLSNDEVAVQRQKAALVEIQATTSGRLGYLRGVLLDERKPTFRPQVEPPPLNERLNETQREAVSFCLAAKDVALIHGPPGTGKTTTVVELIRQSVRRGELVLACAPSNMAVDNMFQRLLAAGESVVRLGHPARVLPELRSHTLDLLVDEHHDVRLARKLVREAIDLFRSASRYTRAKPARGERRDMRAEAKQLMWDARRLERQAVQSILDTANILCCTLTGLDAELLGKRHFDLVVIDEACQSTEPGCWIPLLRGERVVLAGDHCQLPPTIISDDAAAQGFGISLFERIIALHGAEVSRRLEVQYRMHRAIMEFSSREFYDGALTADASVQDHLLKDLSYVREEPLTSTPIDFIDTAGAGYDEEKEPEGESKRNPREAELLRRKVEALLDTGLAPEEIAVIAPYAAQVRLLRERLPLAGLEVDTVDGFQGREKEAVVISLVRSNNRQEIGFLSDQRRMNVALTRARRKLIIIGDSATLSSSEFFARMIEYFEQIGAYHTVWEEADEME